MKPNPIDEMWLRHSGAVLFGAGAWSFFVFSWVGLTLLLGRVHVNDQLITRQDNPGTYWAVICGATAGGMLVVAYGLWNRKRARARMRPEE